MAYIDVSGLAGITLLAGVDPVARDFFLSANTVDAEVNPIDIYKEMRICRRLNESLRPYNVFMAAFGNISKGGGKYTERYVQLLEGTRIVPYDISHELTIIGVIITDDGQEGVACFDRSGLTATTVVDINYVPPQVEVVRAEAELDALLKASYNNVVIVDAANGESGTGQNVNGDYIGTAVAPSDNITDAKIIAINLGITVLSFRGNYTFQAADNVDGWQLKGQGLGKTTFTFNTGCSTAQTVLRQATLTGVANGTLTIDKSELVNLSGVGGTDTDMLWTDCAFDGTTTLASGNTVELHIVNGRSSIAGTGTPVLNINGSNTDIDNRGYLGGIEYTNNTATNSVSVDMLSGHVNIDATIINGTWVIRGQGKLTDDSTGIANIDSSNFVQADVLQDGIERGSYIGKEGLGAAIKPSTGVDGIEWPIGTRKDPCQTVTNAHDICEANGFRDIYCMESITINESMDDGYTFFGDNPQLVNIHMDALSSVNGCKFQDAYVTGKLTSANIVWECIIGSTTGVNSFIYKTALLGPLVLGTGTSTSINKSWVAPTAVNAQVTLDFNNQASSCFISQFEQGKILAINMTTGSILHMAGTGGRLIVDASCTGGTVAHGGAIALVNNGTPDVLMNSTTSAQVWRHTASDYNDPTTFGGIVNRLNHLEYRIFIDTNLVTTGNEDGSQEFPFNILSDAIDHAEANGIDILVIMSDITLDRSLKNFRIEGIGVPTVDTNGQDLKGTWFNKCTIEGAYVNNITAQDCNLFSCDLEGFFENCVFNGTFIVHDTKSALVKDCAAYIPVGTIKPIFDIAGALGTASLTIMGYQGGIEIINANQLTDDVKITVDNGIIELDSTCSNGNIIMFGAVETIRNDTGSTVIDNTIKPSESKDVHTSQMNRRITDEINKEIVVYEDDKVTPRKVFDYTENVDGEIITVTPQ